MSAISQLILEQGRAAAQARAANAELWGRTIDNISQIPGNVYAQRLRQQAADRQAAYEKQRLDAETARAQSTADLDKARYLQEVATHADAQTKAHMQQVGELMAKVQAGGYDPGLYSSAVKDSGLFAPDEQEKLLGLTQDPVALKQHVDLLAPLQKVEDFTLRPGEQRFSGRSLSQPPQAAPQQETPDYGLRYNNGQPGGAPKGLGYFGPLKRPDGSTMTEFSIGVDIDGKETEIPSLVPTLTKAEVQTLVNLPEGQPIPRTIAEKATAYAKQRIAAGKDPFAGAGEQQNLYPDLARNQAPPVSGGLPPGAARPIASVPAATPRLTFGQPQTQLVDGKEQLVRAGSDGKMYDLNQQPIDPSRVKPRPTTADVNNSEPQLPEWATDASRPAGADANKVDPVTGLTPNGLYQDAITYMETFHFPPQGIGNQPRPKAVRAAIQNKVGAIAAAAGMDVPTFAAAYKANATSLAQQQRFADTAQAFLATADKNTALLQSTLKKLPDTGSPIFNQPLRTFEQKVAGDPNLSQFATYLRSVQNEYARIITNPNLTGQLTDTAREETAGLIAPDATVQQILASVSALQSEGHNRLVSVGEQLKRIMDRTQNSTGAAASTPTEGTEGVINGTPAVWKTVNGKSGWYAK